MRGFAHGIWLAFKTHWAATVVALLGSMLFFFASLFETSIRDAFPIYWGPYDGHLSVPAVVFWGGLAVLTVMLALKNKADDSARQVMLPPLSNG